jgi:pSer/pThr/pTyr-binding forkhead associated (FHA) protein
MAVRLVVYRDGKPELCVPLIESGASIGRGPGNAVQLPLPDVSKRHAFLQHTPRGWCIRDLDSRNGLFLNGIKAREGILQEGDRLVIGPYTLVFQISEAAQTYKPVLQIDVSDDALKQTLPAERSKKSTGTSDGFREMAISCPSRDRGGDLAPVARS